MNKWLMTTVATIAILFGTLAVAKPLNLNEISEAVCRVKVETWNGKDAGTGTCIGETPDGEYFHILTNAHVVGQSRQATVEFFKGGYKTSPLPAQIVWKAYQEKSDIDFAIMTVKKSLFGNQPPRIIPLVPHGYKSGIGNYIAVVGCPSARWAQAWEGHITQDRQTRVLFSPPPVGGQSGSGVTVIVPGKDGELYTRIGAVLTWRIGEDTGDNASGGAIPISTLYNIMEGTHTAYQVPSNYVEASESIEVSTVATDRWALGSNGKFYRVYRVNGADTVSFGRDTHVKIVTWDYYQTGLRGGGSSGGFSGGSSGGGWRPSPQPQQPPQPQVPPYSQGPGNGQNPYGANPPNIFQPWPGAEEPKVEEPKVEEEPVELPPISPELQALADKYNALALDKYNLEQEIEKQAEVDIAKAKAEKEAAEAAEAEQESEVVAPVGWLARLKDSMNTLFGGILISSGVGLLILLWNKVLRKRLVKHIDSVQDYIQDIVTVKYGKEMGEECRELMEGVEEALLGECEDFIQGVQARTKVAKATAKGKPAERIANGSSPQRNLTASEVLEAVRQVSDDDDDSSVTTAGAKKVDEILKRVAEDKK